MDSVRKISLAPVFMILSALAFAAMGAAVRLSGGIPFIQKVFFRNAVMTAAVIPVLAVEARRFGLSVFTGTSGTRGLLFLRSMLGLGGVMLYFYSIGKLTLADAAMLNKLSAFFVMIMSALFLGERIKAFQVPALAGAFAGSLMIIKPGFSLSAGPALTGIAASVLAAAAYTVIARLKGRVRPLTVIFWFSAVSTVLCAVPTAAVWKAPGEGQWAALVFTGVFAAAGQYFLTLAYTYGPAGEVSIYNYTNVVFSAVMGFFLWGELPDMLSAAGAVLIVASAVWLNTRSRKEGV